MLMVLPDYFGFVKGLVDSQDLSLNISRELLQHDRQLKVMAKAIEKKIKSELEKMMASDRSAYEKFFDAFGIQLKYGVYSNYGMHKDMLQDLVVSAVNEALRQAGEAMDKGMEQITGSLNLGAFGL